MSHFSQYFSNFIIKSLWISISTDNSFVRNIVVKNIEDCFVKEVDLFMNIFTFKMNYPCQKYQLTD